MKRKILFAIKCVMFTILCNAQPLLNIDFENYNLGNLGTDPTGTIAGQGNWFSIGYNNPSNNLFNITTEPFKGKVLTVNTQKNDNSSVFRNDLDILINQRAIGNNVIKFEMDYYTGSQHYMLGSNGATPFNNFIIYDKNNERIFEFYHKLYYQASFFHARFYDGTNTTVPINFGKDAWDAPLFENNWVTLIVYLDYDNKKIYIDIPYFNIVKAGDFLSKSSSTNLINDFKPFKLELYTNGYTISNIQYLDYKIDNIKLTGLKVVPSNIISLSINEQLATKFNIFPNPAKEYINITNNENLIINQIKIYNNTGKLLSTQNYNHKVELQINVANLSSGSYILHLQTVKGTAIKKFIKI
ncbi:T9SS type A sorting domain-containing protein [Myroides sp. JBRI-B21084]|uniref:T9SS type A sorting domain-containing protein n=1 Tax=Myroides sp. JBRI-B21084 TaxID=3119977 RepID=UPI0026E302B2|nr:T9SS type A sorting domain-containing protein [Paenimyroides cloacae]WKW46168.1 T9SS type A sorting domain-containing protein [Paenimyroides cloacae]